MRAVSYGQENKEVIVLLHGGGLCWWHYREAAQLLCTQYHVVLPILDGHAGSDRPFTTIENNAAEIVTYIDAHFGGHVRLIGGCSLGGQVLTEILAQRSGICDDAFIESTLVLPMKLTAALVKPAFALCYPLIRQRWFARLQFWSLGIRKELFEDYFKDTACISKSDMTAFLAANADYHPKETLSECKAKALIAAGSREQPIMKKSALLLAGRMPKAEAKILKGFSHGDLSLNHPELFADMLLRLMDK